MILGSLCPVVSGGTAAFIYSLRGSASNIFAGSGYIVDEPLAIFIEHIIFGAFAIFGGWGMNYFWMTAGENQVN
jgi:hypothetical protein